MISLHFCTLVLALLGSGFVTDAFIAPRPLTVPLQTTALADTYAIFEGIKEPIQSYINLYVPAFKEIRETGLVPEWLLHWGHGSAMATVYLSMGGIGSFFGWQIRNGNGNDVNALTLGESIREAHPKIAGGALFFFVLGGQGGLVLSAVQRGEILSTPHAVTAALSLGLLFAQASLPLLFSSTSAARDIHAYLGTAIMVLLGVHLVYGIQLGLSF